VSHEPFPFIVGVIRSGTTLLRLMLNAHPELAIPPESYFPLKLAPLRRRYERPEGFATERFVLDLDSDPRAEDFRRNWELDLDVVRRALASDPPIDYSDAVRALYRAYATSKGKCRYGDKTPYFVMRMPELVGLFPEARFIHLIRDGRDVACSLVERGLWQAKDFTQAAHLWREWIEKGRSSGLRLGPERYVEIHYEDLVRDPDGTLRRVCDFIEIEYSQGGTYLDHALAEIPAHEHHQHPNITLAPTPQIRDWRSEMSASDLAMFEAIAGGTLTQLGHQRAFEEFPFSILLRARLSVLIRRIRGIVAWPFLAARFKLQVLRAKAYHFSAN